MPFIFYHLPIGHSAVFKEVFAGIMQRHFEQTETLLYLHCSQMLLLLFAVLPSINIFNFLLYTFQI
tara:strand:+ start:337 stop:534 length:198 start_codon:yes stop_codon:yes gene_type:complete